MVRYSVLTVTARPRPATDPTPASCTAPQITLSPAGAWGCAALCFASKPQDTAHRRNRQPSYSCVRKESARHERRCAAAQRAQPSCGQRCLTGCATARGVGDDMQPHSVAAGSGRIDGGRAEMTAALAFSSASPSCPQRMVAIRRSIAIEKDGNPALNRMGGTA